jgi:hypothetical protein
VGVTTTVPPRLDTSGAAGIARPEPKGFRPGSRRRARVAAGTVLAAVAVGGNVLLYTSLDDRTEVLQVVADIRAGEVVTVDDLRVVEADLAPTVPAVPADDLALVADQFARVHIASGTLLAPVLVQPTPLVGRESAVVAIELRPTLVPDGIRERSLLELIVTSAESGADGGFHTTGRAVTRPVEVDGVSGVVSMSVEVAIADAATVAAGDEHRIVLLEPGVDPAYDDGSGG